MVREALISLYLLFHVNDGPLALRFMANLLVIVPRHGETIGGDIEILGVCACVRACVRPSVTKLVCVITSDFTHRFTQYLTQ